MALLPRNQVTLSTTVSHLFVLSGAQTVQWDGLRRHMTVPQHESVFFFPPFFFFVVQDHNEGLSCHSQSAFDSLVHCSGFKDLGPCPPSSPSAAAAT